ncbi:AAA domain-containing protein [Luteococcus japonicus]|uniref:Uridine kinase n=2 Tax=Luteococcus japonicus TaxID=33984 RepID=A0A1R4ID86_9ACTN|nr:MULTISPECIES: hypothetical protein [Luteococcus]MDN5564456.1 cobalt ABC transporter [Luteococcus sp.]ROR54309.1 AAA domain-containing protein [Luteococcus japonicus]SJN17782.1 hypothetical protein FM114_01180 [Luteococcus japonicus LSP_Lj1]
MSGPVRRIIVDGGSGAGKTTFARRLVERWGVLCGESVQLVSLDDCYPGWHGLAAASRMVVADILRAHDPGYRRWDWERREPADWVALDPGLPMVVEGCGALTHDSARLADLSFWLDMPADERRSRALARDGASYEPWWEVWAAQEAEHWRRHEPQRLACMVVIPPH